MMEVLIYLYSYKGKKDKTKDDYIERCDYMSHLFFISTTNFDKVNLQIMVI